MRLEFTRIFLKDFKEYRGKHALDLAGMGAGLHYVRGSNLVDPLGSNGAGKSTLWDAFLWALTGRTVRGLRGTDVRTWGGKANAVVKVTFYRGDDKHTVKRSTAKNGLWLDGKLAGQEEIDRLIGLNIVNIPHTILLGQKQDLFFDLKPAPKLALLSETLDLDRWERRSKDAKAKADALEANRDKVLYGIDQSEKLIETHQKALALAKEAASDWERERAAHDGKREDIVDKLTKALAKAKDEAGPYDLAYDSAETELRAARANLVKKGAERDALVDLRSKAIEKRNARQHEYEDLRELATSDTCPTCGQGLHKHKKIAADAKAKLKEAKAAAALTSDRVIVRSTQITLIDAAINNTRKAIVEFGKKSDDAKDKLDQLTARIADIEKQISVARAESREHEENPHSVQAAVIRATITGIKKGMAEEKALAAKLDKRAERARYWIKGFRQIRLYLLQEALEELEEATTNILPELGLAGWRVEYDIERETKAGSISTGLTVRILRPGMSKPVKWEAWSGGESQRLLIAGAMALSDVLLKRAGIECDLLVLDEPTRHMSKEGVDETVSFLKERASRGDVQCFYVDHQAQPSNRFASTLTITKDEQGARIETTAAGRGKAG